MTSCRWCLHGIVDEGVRTRKNLCIKHKKFRVMRKTSARRGKAVPTFEQLESALASLVGMRCPACNVTMTWSRSEETPGTVLSVQHFRSGQIGFVCLSCNVRHEAFPDDSYLDYPQNYRWCPGCNAPMPDTEFFNDRNSGRGKSTYCKRCTTTRRKAWQRRNRETFNQYQRQYRQKKKAEGVVYHKPATGINRSTIARCLSRMASSVAATGDRPRVYRLIG